MRYSSRGSRLHTVEQLESRNLLAILVVDTASPGIISDGLVSLDEAILAANSDSIADEIEGVQQGSGDDIIRFSPAIVGETLDLFGQTLVTESLDVQGSLETITRIHAENLIVEGANEPIQLRILDSQLTGNLTSDERIELHGGVAEATIRGSGEFRVEVSVGEYFISSVTMPT